MMNRREILEQTIQCVCHDREDTHGKPENSFTLIAEYWKVYMGYMDGRPPNAQDVANMMVLFKMARAQMQGQNEDNFIDMAGYAALAGELK